MNETAAPLLPPLQNARRIPERDQHTLPEVQSIYASSQTKTRYVVVNVLPDFNGRKGPYIHLSSLPTGKQTLTLHSREFNAVCEARGRAERRWQKVPDEKATH